MDSKEEHDDSAAETKGLQALKWEQRSSVLLKAQTDLLRMTAPNRPLKKILHRLIRFLESESKEAICSVITLDSERKDIMRIGAAPSVPQEINEAVDGLAIGPKVGSCGTAIYLRKTVEVADIANDPLWVDYRDLLLRHDLKACTSCPILDSQGEPLGSFAFYYRTVRPIDPYDLYLIHWARDIASIAIERSFREKNQKKRLEQEHKSRLEAERLSRLKDEFLSVASHEMRSPLAAMKMYLQLFSMNLEADKRSEVPKEEVTSFLKQTHEYVNRMSKTISNLFHVSIIRHKGINLRYESFDLVGVMATLLETYRQQSAVSITLEGPRELLGNWDRRRLEQVFSNLIENALKYGDNKDIKIVLEKMDDQVVVTVLDQGIGISPIQQSRIFNRFEQAHTKLDVQGLGLGLYIVHKIVESLQGRISVVSSLGQGTSIIVELPLEPGGNQ